MDRYFSGSSLGFSFKQGSDRELDIVPWAGTREWALTPSGCFVWLARLRTVVMFHRFDAIGSEPELPALWVWRGAGSAGALAGSLGVKYTVAGFPPWAEAQSTTGGIASHGFLET